MPFPFCNSRRQIASPSRPRRPAAGGNGGCRSLKPFAKCELPRETRLKGQVLEVPAVGNLCMPAVSHPSRSPVFRLITIASSGLGSFILGLWGLQFGFGDGVVGLPAEVVGAVIAGLCAIRRRCDVLLRGRRRVGGLRGQGDAFRQADRVSVATGHDRQDRRGRAGNEKDRRADLPDRHRYWTLQADQRIDRLRQGRRTGSRLRPAAEGGPAGQGRHRPHRRRRVRGALPGRLFQHVDGRHRRAADRRADGALRPDGPPAVGQRVDRGRRHARTATTPCSC